MKVVVTGGAGFVGSHLAHELAGDHDVHVVDDLSLGDLERVPEQATLHEVSVLDRDALDAVFEDARFVFHEAALPSVPRSVKNPKRSHEVNATGTLQVLLAARDSDVEKVVYASSSSAYGDNDTLPKRPSHPPKPLSPYAVSKQVGEDYCRVFTEVYGLRTTSLRYFNVYGPHQRPQGEYAAVIPKFARAAVEDQPLTVHGDGSQTRDFTFVSDVVQANLRSSRSGEADGEVLNVGTGERTSILELAEKIREIAGSDSEIVHMDRRPGDVDDSLASIERTRELTGYDPEIDLEEGLERTVAWFADQTAPEIA